MQPAVQRVLGLADGRHAAPGRAIGAAAAAAAFVVLLLPQPAASQSLLQSLFGFGSAPPPRAAMPPLQSYPMRSAPYFYPGDRGSDLPRSAGGGGTYRTVCVRLCDGYYFPISHGVSRASFSRDARACQSSCGSDTRLFYQSTGESDAADMVDISGRSYSSLQNAFRYRKALVEGCTCKPAPWSEASLARHRGYAAAAGVGMGTRTAAGPAMVAGEPARPQSTIVAGAGVDEPQSLTAPIERPSPLEPPQLAEPAGLAGQPRPLQPRRTQQAAIERPLQAMPQPAPRATPRPVASVPPPARPPAVAKAAPKAKAVYSHEHGRFLFPGESR